LLQRSHWRLKHANRADAWHKKVRNGTLRLKQARAQELAYKRARG
jgi:hypothetical protein